MKGPVQEVARGVLSSSFWSIFVEQMQSAAESLKHLRSAWARQILYWWKQYNSLYLREALVAPLIEISSSKSYMGRWRNDPPVITIAMIIF